MMILIEGNIMEADATEINNDSLVKRQTKAAQATTIQPVIQVNNAFERLHEDLQGNFVQAEASVINKENLVDVVSHDNIRVDGSVNRDVSDLNVTCLVQDNNQGMKVSVIDTAIDTAEVAVEGFVHDTVHLIADEVERLSSMDHGAKLLLPSVPAPVPLPVCSDLPSFGKPTEPVLTQTAVVEVSGIVESRSVMGSGLLGVNASVEVVAALPHLNGSGSAAAAEDTPDGLRFGAEATLIAAVAKVKGKQQEAIVNVPCMQQISRTPDETLKVACDIISKFFLQENTSSSVIAKSTPECHHRQEGAAIDGAAKDVSKLVQGCTYKDVLQTPQSSAGKVDKNISSSSSVNRKMISRPSCNGGVRICLPVARAQSPSPPPPAVYHPPRLNVEAARSVAEQAKAKNIFMPDFTFEESDNHDDDDDALDFDYDERCRRRPGFRPRGVLRRNHFWDDFSLEF